MSYDISLVGNPERCDKCEQLMPGPTDCPGPTYNLGPVFQLALTDELPGETRKYMGLRVLDGMTGSASYRMIVDAIGRMGDPGMGGAFAKLEPPNKWGNLRGAKRVMEQLLELAHKWPDHTWRIS